MFNSKQEYNDYTAAHMWVAYHFGRPHYCESCLTTEKRMYHWANISREYKRDRSDWLRLCVPCHKRNDVKTLGGKIKARPQKVQPSKFCTECNVEFFKNPHLSRKQWETTFLCSKPCSAKWTGRKLIGNRNAVRVQ